MIITKHTRTYLRTNNENKFYKIMSCWSGCGLYHRIWSCCSNSTIITPVFRHEDVTTFTPASTPTVNNNNNKLCMFCTYIYIHTYIIIIIYRQTLMITCVPLYIHTYIHVYTYVQHTTCIHIKLYTYIRIYIHTDIHTHCYIPTHHTYTYTYYSGITLIFPGLKWGSPCLYAYTYIHAYSILYIYILYLNGIFYFNAKPEMRTPL